MSTDGINTTQKKTVPFMIVNLSYRIMLPNSFPFDMN